MVGKWWYNTANLNGWQYMAKGERKMRKSCKMDVVTAGRMRQGHMRMYSCAQISDKFSFSVKKRSA